MQEKLEKSTSRNNFNLLWIPFCRNPTERPVGQEGQERIRDPVKRYVWDRKKIESMGLCQTFTTTFDLFRKLLTFFNYRLLDRTNENDRMNNIQGRILSKPGLFSNF